MKKLKILFLFVFLITFMASFHIVNNDILEKDSIDCDKIGVAYLTEDEMKNADDIRKNGVITYSPSTSTLIAETEVLNCDNIRLYLKPLN